MEGSGMMSAADIAAVTRPNMYGYGGGYGDGFGFGGGNGLWFALFLLLGLGGNGFGYGRGVDGRVATVDELNNSANFTRLESQVQGIGSSIAQGFRNVDNAVCQLGYQGLQNYANLSKELAGCCCEQKQIALENRYLSAQNTAEINANIAAWGQKLLDARAQDKIESLQAQISKMQLDQALCNVVRYPNQFTIPSCNPFAGWNNNCGC